MDEDDVSGVKPLTIWQQKAVREAHGLELEKEDIQEEIVELQKSVDELTPQVDVLKSALWDVRKKMGSYPTWVTRGDDIRALHSRKLGAADAPDVSSRRIQRECELLTRRTGFILERTTRQWGKTTRLRER